MSHRSEEQDLRFVEKTAVGGADRGSGAYVDSAHPAVAAFAQEVAGSFADPAERARALYDAVRDRVIYDPYRDFADLDTYRASACLLAGRGFCVAKAALLAASARVVGIEAMVGFADVKNHLATPRLLELIGSDVFLYHGYAALRLGGRWVKATPTFNLSLCERFGVKPLEFDGESDALFHPFDRRGRRHMEYLRDHGLFADVPAEQIREIFRKAYPKTFTGGGAAGGDFAAEAQAERAS
jgi:transglutaminase-like putative cysteine protease